MVAGPKLGATPAGSRAGQTQRRNVLTRTTGGGHYELRSTKGATRGPDIMSWTLSGSRSHANFVVEPKGFVPGVPPGKRLLHLANAPRLMVQRLRRQLHTCARRIRPRTMRLLPRVGGEAPGLRRRTVDQDKIIVSIGSSEPLIREYVHDFGLCAMNIVWLECALREHLRRLAVLRATWPLKVKNYWKKLERFEEMTLGGLVTEYESLQGDPDLVAGLRRVADGRGYLFHNRITLFDPDQGRIPRRRVHEVRGLVHELWADARDRDKAIEKADQRVFEQIMERIRIEQPSDPATMAETQAIIDLNGRRVKNHPNV